MKINSEQNIPTLATASQPDWSSEDRRKGKQEEERWVIGKLASNEASLQLGKQNADKLTNKRKSKKRVTNE